MLRVFIVSPLPAIRAGLRALLEAECDVAGEASALGAAGGRVLEAAPEVVIVDAQPGLDVAELVEAGLAGHDDAGPGLLVLGPVPADAALPGELGGRAWGYVPREASAEQLVAAVRAVGAGLVALDPRVGGHLFARGDGARPAPAAGPHDELTAREREVLQLVAQGLANKAIARRLAISEHTVKFHVAAILGKLGAGSRTEAVHLGARRGLVAL